MDERENAQRRRKNGEIVWFYSTFHRSTTICVLAERCNVMHWKTVAGSFKVFWVHMCSVPHCCIHFVRQQCEYEC